MRERGPDEPASERSRRTSSPGGCRVAPGEPHRRRLLLRPTPGLRLGLGDYLNVVYLFFFFFIDFASPVGSRHHLLSVDVDVLLALNFFVFFDATTRVCAGLALLAAALLGLVAIDPLLPVALVGLVAHVLAQALHPPPATHLRLVGPRTTPHQPPPP